MGEIGGVDVGAGGTLTSTAQPSPSSSSAHLGMPPSPRGMQGKGETASTTRIDAEMGEIGGVDVGAGGTLTSTAQPSPPSSSAHLGMPPSPRGMQGKGETASTTRINAEMGEIGGVDVGAGGTLTSTAQPSPPSSSAHLGMPPSPRGMQGKGETASTTRIDAEMGEIGGVDVGAGGTLTSTAQPSPPSSSAHLGMPPSPRGI
ncbi:hypothetical protein V8D89_008877 [Ganoderma adspersum]